MTIRVLLVEPDIAIAQPISQQLQHLDCLVVGQASNPATALTQASTLQPELVILNLSLQGSLETAQQLNCPVIYITPTADETTLAIAEATNPCGYLLTPFTPPQLRLSLQTALNHFQTQQKLHQSQAESLDITHLKETELALRQSEQRYRQIIETAQEGICFLDPQNRYTYVNQRLADSLGYTVAEMRGKTPLDFMDDTTQGIARQKLAQRHQGIQETFDFQFRHKDGSVVWMLIAANSLLDEAGNYQGCFGMLTDITQRKQTETILQKLVEGTAATVGEDFFPALAQSLANVLNVRHVLVSRYLDDQITTLALWSNGQLQPNLSYPATTPPCYFTLQEGEYYCGSRVQQNFCDNALLTQFQAESYFSVALKSVAGETLGLICVAHDEPLKQEQYQQYRGILETFAIRAAAELERQKITVALEQKTQEQAALLQALPDFIIRFSQDGKYLDYQVSDSSLLYKSPEEFLGKYLDEVIPAKPAKIILDAIAQLQQTQSLTVCQYELPIGESISYREARLVPFRDNQVIAIIRDISSRKQAELDLKRQKQFIERITETNPNIIYIYDLNTQENVYCNRAIIDLLGYTPEEICQYRRLDLIYPDDLPMLMTKHQQMRELPDQEVIEYDYRIRDAQENWRWFNTHATPFKRDETGQVYQFLGTTIDITERQMTEKALQRSEERFRTSVETLLDGFAIFETVRDETGKIVDFRYEYINEAGCELMQRPRAEILGNTICSLLPNHRETGLLAEYVRVVETGKPLIKEMFTYEDVYGEKYLQRAFSFQAMKLGNGFVVTWRDVTDQKQAQRRLQASLQEKEVLLKEIHHRVKNNLQIIQSLLRLQSAYIDDPQTLQMFRDSQSRIRSMALIHEHLYRSEDLAQIDFTQYIQNLAQSLFRAYNSSKQINLELNLVSAQISLDTALPCGLIINELVSNALKYAFNDGRSGLIEIRLQREAMDQFILTVADNGVGLPAEISPQTTDSLGLQLVSDCTRQLEGKLQLKRGGGTRFIISFREA